MKLIVPYQLCALPCSFTDHRDRRRAISMAALNLRWQYITTHSLLLIKACPRDEAVVAKFSTALAILSWEGGKKETCPTPVWIKLSSKKVSVYRVYLNVEEVEQG
jgi:hypothetical protein